MLARDTDNPAGALDSDQRLQRGDTSVSICRNNSCWTSRHTVVLIRARNAGLPHDRRIEFRIGVNVGDVIVAPDDIYGHGVNVAARLEGLAPPGGICISADAWGHVRGAVAAEFVDLGEQRLRTLPIRRMSLRLLPLRDAARRDSCSRTTASTVSRNTGVSRARTLEILEL
jgi:class 3 adenylate cyclase